MRRLLVLVFILFLVSFSHVLSSEAQMIQDRSINVGGSFEGNAITGDNAVVGYSSGSVDLSQLANELSVLRKAMTQEATDLEHSIAVGDIAKAEQAAGSNDSEKVMEYLRSAGKWALDIASKIGVPLAVDALRRAMGAN